MPQHAEREPDANDEVFHRVHETAEVGESFAAIAGGFADDSMLPPGLGLASGLVSTPLAMMETIKHPTIGHGLDVAAGATGIVGDVAELAGSEVAETLGPVGAAIGGARTLNDLRNGDYAGATRDGVGTVLDALGPEGAAAAGAWNLGWTTGEHLDHWANGEAAERNYLGGHRTVDEHAMDVGDSVNHFIGHGKVGQVAGAFAAAGTGLADTGYTGLRYGADEAADGVKWAGRKAGRALSAAEGLLPGRGGPSIPEIVDREVAARMALDHAQSTYAHDPQGLEIQLLAMKKMGYGALVHDAAPAAAPAAPDQTFQHVFQHYAD
jgi:hypothetical protein